MVNSSTDNSATDGADPPLNYSLYSEGEKVLAYHRNRIYEAKVQKIEPRENEQRYFLHYLGWNKVSWDEWVGVDRLLKYNEENIMKQKTLDMTQSVDNNTASGQLTQMNPESPPVEKGRKRKNDSSAEVWNTLGLNDTVSLERLVNSQILSTLRKPVGDELKFICQQEKQDLLGMDAGSSCQINETNKKGCRRHWTKKEEDALLRILEDLVAKGHRVNRVFRPGTLNVVENALCNLCPGSDLKASPHIESKLKKLKKQFRIVYDMVNSPGFGWNNAEKCVKVNSEKAWKAYLQHHKEAYGWRGKYFPHYDGLVKIFKVDNANGKASGNPGEIVEEINCDEVNATVFGIEEDTCPRSVDQISTTKQTDQSHSSQRKRRRQDDTRDSPIIERAKKGYRYRWTKEEEGALLGILEDLVAKGHCDNGTFRSSAMTLIENALSNLCPESGLKATPHVESKLKKWKKEYRIVNDMLNRNGFRWNGLKKSVEVDSEEAWKAYVQHHKEADGWRDKYFPIYDLFVNIFDVKRVPAKPSQTPVERVGAINRDEEIRGDEDINCDEDVGSEEESADFGTNEGASSRSIDQISTNNQTDQSHSSPQRSGRQEDGFGVPVDEVPAPVMDVVKTSNEQMRVLHESRQSPKGNKIDELYREVKVLGLPVTDRVKVLRLLVTKPLNAELFLTLDREEKLEFVKLLVEEASKK